MGVRMSEFVQTYDELRQAALAKVRAGEIEEALALYDAAFTAAADDEARELITINKADALIAGERTGPEVQALATILMRRRNLHHVYLAAYALVFKYRTENELKRAMFYAQVALSSAEEAENAVWKIGALNELGVLYEMNSQFQPAIDCFEQALALLGRVDDEAQRAISRVIISSNLAASRLLTGATVDGLTLMNTVIDDIKLPHAKADSLIDLCYGYLELQQYDEARKHGEAALTIATDPRQIRNAHYLLGEAAYKSGDVDMAEFHFDELAKFYPDFRHLKSVLYAIDLRSLINLRL